MRSVSARERACIEEERGLSELVFLCLGLPLDKTYQISDWERRPLSEEQLVYAGKCVSNYSCQRPSSEPIKIRSKSMRPAQSAGKRVCASRDWLWFYC